MQRNTLEVVTGVCSTVDEAVEDLTGTVPGPPVRR